MWFVGPRPQSRPRRMKYLPINDLGHSKLGVVEVRTYAWVLEVRKTLDWLHPVELSRKGFWFPSTIWKGTAIVRLGVFQVSSFDYKFGVIIKKMAIQKLISGIVVSSELRELWCLLEFDQSGCWDALKPTFITKRAFMLRSRLFLRSLLAFLSKRA